MENKLLFGISLIAINLIVWMIIGMLLWKNRNVDTYVYQNER